MTSLKTVNILVASNAIADAELAAAALRREFEHVQLSCRAESPAADFERCKPELLVLAFRDLGDAERHCAALRETSDEAARTQRYRSLVLCRTEDVAAAFQRCKDGLFHDYVQFWPMSFDVLRLPMSALLALRHLRVAEAAVALQRATQSGPAEGPGRASVLVVDDDEFQQKILSRLIEKQDLDCEVASSGTAAIEALGRRRPALVLLDYMLPDFDGIAVLRRLRSMPGLASVPVVMLTGNGNKELVVASMQAGANDFLVKPVDAEGLREKLRRYVGATS